MSSKKTEPISNLGWFFLFSFVVVVDIAQIVLDLAFGAGVLVNRIIDVGVAFALLLIFHLKDVPLTQAQYMSIGSAFIGEQIPVLDALPMWTFDIFYIFVNLKKEEISEKMGIVGKIAVTAVDTVQKARGGGVASVEAGAASGVGNTVASAATAEHLPTNTIDLRPSGKA